MKVLTINLPEVYLKYIQTMIDTGFACSRSEYIRIAVKNQVDRDLRHADDLSYKMGIHSNYAIIPGYNNNKPVKVRRLIQ